MHLRRRVVRVMMVMAVMDVRLHSLTEYGLSKFRSTHLLDRRNEIFDTLHQNFTSGISHRSPVPTILTNPP